MHDLRKKALLESGKTVSRKARSATNTPSSSRAGSQVRPGLSRTASRNPSDDEDGMSDTTNWSIASLDDGAVGDGPADDVSQEAWIADLHDRIAEIVDRKRSSAEGRENTLQAFNMDIMRHYAEAELKPKVNELLPALLKSVKAGQTERETVLALKALALLLITTPSEKVYDAVAGTFKSTISDSPHAPAKGAAIRALSIATFYGGATDDEALDVMDLYLEIVSSDGHSIDEPDNADLVVAALEEWGVLATSLEDLSEATEPAMETFVDQLESSDASVQIAAGNNIALLFEKSYTEAESDDEPDPTDDANHPNGDATGMVKRYTAYRQQAQLQHTLATLSKSSSKRVSKRDRRDLRQVFADVLRTVEVPTRGPRYSTALDEDGREFGSRLRVTVPGGGKMTVDRWWKLHRLNGLKRLLQGGFLTHYEGNEVVFDSLPVAVEDR